MKTRNQLGVPSSELRVIREVIHVYSRAVKESLEKSSWIRKMFEEGAELKRRHGVEEVFDFSIGNPFGEPPPEFYRFLIEILKSPEPGMHGYMANAGYTIVREEKARELEEITGRHFTGEVVVMTSGASGGLNVALKALLNPGEKVICLAPYFVEYLPYITNHGGIPLVLDTSGDFEPDLAGLEANLTGDVKAVIINTPNNPTGRIYREETLKGMAEILERYEKRRGKAIYVISDEPYRKIVYGGGAFIPPARYIRNCIVVYSHSKDLNIPGERIGYAAVSPDATLSSEIFDAMVYTNRTLGFVNAPALMQRVSMAVHGGGENMAVYEENRERLSSMFNSLGIDYQMPDGAFYFFPRTPQGVSEGDFTGMAREHRILIVPGSGFGRDGHFRVAFCTSTDVVKKSEEAWKRLVARVREI